MPWGLGQTGLPFNCHRLPSASLIRCEVKNKETFGKCNNLHGHNYKAEFSFSGFIDQETGMVVNISDLKVILQVGGGAELIRA